mgnify:FL=1
MGASSRIALTFTGSVLFKIVLRERRFLDPDLFLEPIAGQLVMGVSGLFYSRICLVLLLYMNKRTGSFFVLYGCNDYSSGIHISETIRMVELAGTTYSNKLWKIISNSKLSVAVKQFITCKIQQYH